jgi:hypothetical protein
MDAYEVLSVTIEMFGMGYRHKHSVAELIGCFHQVGCMGNKRKTRFSPRSGQRDAVRARSVPWRWVSLCTDKANVWKTRKTKGSDGSACFGKLRRSPTMWFKLHHNEG